MPLLTFQSCFRFVKRTFMNNNRKCTSGFVFNFVKSKTVGDAKTGFARIKTEIFPTRLFSPTKFRVYLWIRPEAKYTRGVLHRLLDLSNLVFVVLTSVIAVSDFWCDKRSCQIEQLSLTNCHGCKCIMAEIRYPRRGVLENTSYFLLDFSD